MKNGKIRVKAKYLEDVPERLLGDQLERKEGINREFEKKNDGKCTSSSAVESDLSKSLGVLSDEKALRFVESFSLRERGFTRACEIIKRETRSRVEGSSVAAAAVALYKASEIPVGNEHVMLDDVKQAFLSSYLDASRALIAEEEWDKADEQLREALRIEKEIGEALGMAKRYVELALVSLKKLDFDASIRRMRICMKHYEIAGAHHMALQVGLLSKVVALRKSRALLFLKKSEKRYPMGVVDDVHKQIGVLSTSMDIARKNGQGFRFRIYSADIDLGEEISLSNEIQLAHESVSDEVRRRSNLSSIRDKLDGQAVGCERL